MENTRYKILCLLVLFSRNAVGCINNPYITYRKLADRKTDGRQLVFIFLLSLLYFLFASWIRSGIRNPYLLTFKFNLLLLGALVGFCLMIFCLFLLGKIFKRISDFRALIILWSFTLLPTIIWFFLTSLFYLLLPPPRTLSLWGKIFSLMFIFLSTALLFWKMILVYLTMRFGLRFDLFKIVISSFILIPLIIIFSFMTHQYGIFRIPFI